MLLPDLIIKQKILVAISCKGKVKCHMDSWSHFFLFKVVILQGRRDFVLLLLFEL